MYALKDITPDLIAKTYFEKPSADIGQNFNSWFHRASSGNVGFRGTIVGWIDIDKEMTSEQMAKDHHGLLNNVRNVCTLDIKSFDILVLYGAAKSGVEQRGMMIKPNPFMTNIKMDKLIGMNFLFNSPIFK